MIPVIRLDPSSLSLWYNPELINQVPYKEEIALSVHYAMLGDVPALREHISGIADERVKVKCIHLASSVWYEQRHFLDLILTNYGALRLRQFLILYVNIPTLVTAAKEADGKLACPIDLYQDSLRRKMLGVSSIDPLATVGGESRKRKIFLQEDRQLLPTFAGKMECGGEAQLEALAYYTQHSCIQFLFGNEMSVKVQQELTDEQKKSLKYTWAQIVANTFGLLPARSEGATTGSVDVSFLLPIIYGSLMSRAWGQAQVKNEKGATDFPLTRLAGLLNALRGKFKAFGEISIEDAWEVVNATAKQLWGRTILEELDEDYKREGEWCDQIRELETVNDTVMIALTDFHNLRGQLITLLKNSPTMIFHPYLPILSGTILPMPVLTAPGGEFGETPEGWDRVFGYQEPDQPKIKWWWAAIPARWPIENDQIYTLKEISSWGRIISYYAPLAKMMMNGRKHRTILGPELITIEKILKAQLDLDLLLDPHFLWPNETDEINAYYTLSDKTEAVCDMCRAHLEKPHGHFLSPWVFRYSLKNAQLAIETYGGGDGGYLTFVKDWSPWLLCDTCYGKVSAGMQAA